MKTLINTLVVLASTLTIYACTTSLEGSEQQINNEHNRPNIVIFYVDDLGYGDIGVNNAVGVETPNIDKLAANGINFTDAHSSAATCTPSRYSLLTGEYAFRKKAAVLQGDAKLLIEPGQATLPSLVKKAGYTSAVVGKWHLGLGDGNRPIDWNGDVKPGPLEIGFDYSYLLPATGDRVPTVYLENHQVQNLDPEDPLSVSYSTKIGARPVGRDRPELLRQQADDQHADSIINGISRIGYMQGGKKAEWQDEDFYNVFTNKANNFIKQNASQPFLLFFSFHDIHVPRLPNKQFQGLSTMGPRGDAIAQMDWITGQVIKQLEQSGVRDNTLIIFTSDNGPVLTDGYDDQALELLGKHKPAGPYRGGKYSAYEAGTRMPTIVNYPAKVKPGVSTALMSQVDFYASIAAMLNISLTPDEAIDSENHLAAWLDHTKNGRETLLEESYTLALRSDDWKYIQPSTNAGDWISQNKHIESGLLNKPQLFNLAQDLGEQHNLADKMPHLVERYQDLLNKQVETTTR